MKIDKLLRHILMLATLNKPPLFIVLPLCYMLLALFISLVYLQKRKLDDLIILCNNESKTKYICNLQQ